MGEQNLSIQKPRKINSLVNEGIRLHQNLQLVSQYTPGPLEFHISKDSNTDNLEGLGRLPSTILSVSSLLLFNSSDNPYKTYINFDNLSGVHTKSKKQIEHDQEELAPAPTTLSGFDQSLLPNPVESYQFMPDVGAAPELGLPTNLPSLNMVADDINWMGPDIDSLPSMEPGKKPAEGSDIPPPPPGMDIPPPPLENDIPPGPPGPPVPPGPDHQEFHSSVPVPIPPENIPPVPQHIPPPPSVNFNNNLPPAPSPPTTAPPQNLKSAIVTATRPGKQDLLASIRGFGGKNRLKDSKTRPISQKQAPKQPDNILGHLLSHLTLISKSTGNAPPTSRRRKKKKKRRQESSDWDDDSSFSDSDTSTDDEVSDAWASDPSQLGPIAMPGT